MKSLDPEEWEELLNQRMKDFMKEILSRLGQHDLTEKEVHDIWIKKRFNAFAEVIGVELEISDIGENGMVSVRALKPVSLAKK